jgi:hypothetical protein
MRGSSHFVTRCTCTSGTPPTRSWRPRGATTRCSSARWPASSSSSTSAAARGARLLSDVARSLARSLAVSEPSPLTTRSRTNLSNHAQSGGRGCLAATPGPLRARAGSPCAAGAQGRPLLLPRSAVRRHRPPARCAAWPALVFAMAWRGVACPGVCHHPLPLTLTMALHRSIDRSAGTTTAHACSHCPSLNLSARNTNRGIQARRGPDRLVLYGGPRVLRGLCCGEERQGVRVGSPACIVMCHAAVPRET